MKKLLLFVLLLVLILNLVGVGLGDGGKDTCVPHCTCKNTCTSCYSYNCYDKCGVSSLKTSKSVRTWYYADLKQKYYDFGSHSYYKSGKLFTDRKYECKSKEKSCGCGVTCTSYYDKCYTSQIRCEEWQECYIDNSCDNSPGCECVDEYCKGWCMDNAPVYDGLAGCAPANDGDWVATKAFSTKPQKYKLNTDFHPANMNGGCYCNYYEIKNFYECDDSFIKDSHPCSSGNCAPDFIGGRSYCCKEGECSHKEDGFRVVCLNGRCDFSEKGDIRCYKDGSEVQYQGYHFICDDGEWDLISGDKPDFSDSCGKTVYNFPLYFDLGVVYPPRYGYKNSYLILPVYFPGKEKDVVASVSPRSNLVKIDVGGKKGSGEDYVVKTLTDRAEVKFYLSDDGIQGKKFNISVNCYTPDKEACNYPDDDCWPTSYCSQDSPTNIYEPNRAYFFCCPNNTCAHKGSCYKEGVHRLITKEEGSADPPLSGCLWRCNKNRWEKQKSGAECKKKCDCSQEGIELNCVETFYNSSVSMCCPEWTCGIKVGYNCVKEGSIKTYKGYTYQCYCNSEGICFWKGAGYKIADEDYTRFLFSENSNRYQTNLKVDKSEFRFVENDEVRRATIYIFFDPGNFGGEINITSGKETLYKGPISNLIELNVKDYVDLSSSFNFPLGIDAKLNKEEYFFYLGSTLVIEY